MPLLFAWLRAFTFTLTVELLVAPRVLGPRWSLGRRLAATAFAQIASHPAVWFIFPLLALPRTPYLVVAESWAILLEAALYVLTLPNLSPRLALLTSLTANALSFGLGTLIRQLWPTL